MLDAPINFLENLIFSPGHIFCMHLWVDTGMEQALGVGGHESVVRVRTRSMARARARTRAGVVGHVFG